MQQNSPRDRLGRRIPPNPVLPAQILGNNARWHFSHLRPLANRRSLSGDIGDLFVVALVVLVGSVVLESIVVSVVASVVGGVVVVVVVLLVVVIGVWALLASKWGWQWIPVCETRWAMSLVVSLSLLLCKSLHGVGVVFVFAAVGVGVRSMAKVRTSWFTMIAALMR